MENPGDWMGHGVPISSGRVVGSMAAISVTRSRAAKLSGPTGCPSTETMSKDWTWTGELRTSRLETPIVWWARTESSIDTTRGSTPPDSSQVRTVAGAVKLGESNRPATPTGATALAPGALLAPSTTLDDAPAPAGTVEPAPAGTVDATPPPAGTVDPPPAGTVDAAPPPAGTVDPPPAGTVDPPPAGTVDPPPAGTVDGALEAEGVWSGHPAPDPEEDEEAEDAEPLALGVPPPTLDE